MIELLPIEKTLFVSPAEDTIGMPSRHLTQYESMKVGQRSKLRLVPIVELAEGMRAVIMLNLSVSADIANGTLGTAEKIFLDAREPPVASGQSVVELKYPLTLLYFKPDRPGDISFPGLPKGIIPISPLEIGIEIIDQHGRKQTVNRRQLSIDGAYAFTDYKSQAQTLCPVLVVLAKPPHWTLSHFNAYVTVSRSTSQKTIWFLRDFDDTLFTTLPDEELILFMQRLDVMDKQTKILFKNGHL
ncbi:hypothetical protein M422DRAFT_243934 [Sphaerobolus stellatus SS14]|nr:hypothetical protein M422DRAFT_243934 [Sphaerobolus stellatus SS14]